MWQFLESKIRWVNFDGAEISGNFWTNFGVNFWEAKLGFWQTKLDFVVQSRVSLLQSRVIGKQKKSRIIEKAELDKQNLIFSSKFTGYVRRFTILFLEQAEFLVMIERISRH